MSANDPKRTFDGGAVFSVLKPWRAAGAELIVDRKVEVVMPEKLDELRAGGQRSYVAVDAIGGYECSLLGQEWTSRRRNALHSCAGGG